MTVVAVRRAGGVCGPAVAFIVTALLVASVVNRSAAGAPPDGAPPMSRADPPLPVTQIAPGVYVYFGINELMMTENGGAIANVAFIVGDDSVAVIDTGGSPREGRRLLAAVRAITAKPIRYVINTHAHPDHIFGNAAFAGTGATFVGHRHQPKALALRGQHYVDALRRTMGHLLDDVAVTAAQQLVGEDVRLDLGNRSLALHAWGTAHSDNDLTVLDESTLTFFAGDLVFNRHVPVLDGSIRGWLAAMDALSRIAAVRAVPGHGPVVEWPLGLAAQQRYLERLAADCRALIAAGTPLDKASVTAGRSEKPFWELFEEYNARNATAAFAELEWE